MARYRKKPVVIEAWQVDMSADTPLWLSDAMNGRGTTPVYYQGGDAPYFTVETLEGLMRANPGDWLIRGVQGEIYPCKDHIFRATYEPAD